MTRPAAKSHKKGRGKRKKFRQIQWGVFNTHDCLLFNSYHRYEAAERWAALDRQAPGNFRVAKLKIEEV